MRHAGARSRYSAAIVSAALDTSPELSTFALRVEGEATRRGFRQAKRQVVLGDGSDWIWNTAKELLPRLCRFSTAVTPRNI